MVRSDYIKWNPLCVRTREYRVCACIATCYTCSDPNSRALLRGITVCQPQYGVGLFCSMLGPINNVLSYDLTHKWLPGDVRSESFVRPATLPLTLVGDKLSSIVSNIGLVRYPNNGSVRRWSFAMKRSWILLARARVGMVTWRYASIRSIVVIDIIILSIISSQTIEMWRMPDIILDSWTACVSASLGGIPRSDNDSCFPEGGDLETQ